MSKIKYIIICILAFFILCGFSQDTKTLDNGLRLIVKEDHRNPIAVFSAFVEMGSAYEGEYLGSGISHLTEHMLFKGTKKYPPGTIEDILHKYGGEIDGFTSYDYTGYRITILKEHTDIALDILKEIFTEPTFNSKELKREMDVIEREMDLNKDDPDKRISRLTFSESYVRHPYNIPIIGYKENFRKLDRDDLVKFFKENYAPEQIIIAVVGDINEDTMFNEMQNIFGEIPRGKNRVYVLPEEPLHLAENYIEEKMDNIEGAYLNIAFQSTKLLHKDLYAMDILSFILGQGESSILTKEIRIKKELAISISAYNYTPKEPGLFVVSSVLKEENTKKTLDEILKEIDKLKETGVAEKDLEKAKNNFLAEYVYEKETIQSQANDLAMGELLTGNPIFFESYIEHIKSVTLEDIKRVANKYLNKENMTVVVLSSSGRTLDISSELVMQKKERDTKKIVLKNKLPLLISENPSLPIVSISMLFKGGVRFETEENNGISKLTSRMIMDGTNSTSREEIASSYESKGMSVGQYSANNSSGITVDCLKEHIEDGLKLISQLYTDSIFPEKELEREKNELNTIIDMQDNDIFNHGQRLLKELLFKTHPYRFQTIGTHESIARIKREDIVNFHKGIFSTDNMVIGICGDCNTENVKALVEKYFPEIPLRTKTYPQTAKEMPLDNKRHTFIKTDKEQSLVLLGFHGIDIYNNERYALEVMMDILSGESGIIFKKIRGRKGLSYTQGGFQVLGLDPGYTVFYVLTSKENIDKVKQTLLDEIASFIKKGAGQEDLQKSKNYLKAMHKIAMQRNAHFVFTTTLDELYGLGYNNYKDYDKNIDEVGKEDIARVAGMYLTLDKYAEVILEGKE